MSVTETPSPHVDAAAKLLPAGGAMGAMARELDWSKTCVGPIAEWPQSLRTAVNIALESKFPMMVAWGADFTQFYNDPFRPILGSTKHPALGKSTRETFAEAWHIVGPLFAQVMAGEAVRFDDMLVPLDRHGYLEECYFVYSYSPIRDDEGGVGGLLVTVAETSERVIAERRLRALRELGARTAAFVEEAAAWKSAADVLLANGPDLPFAFLYVLEADGQSARIPSSPASEWSPAVIALDESSERTWPLARALASGRPELVTDVRARFGDRRGPWPEPVESALVIPLSRAGLERPHGFLVAGISPRLGLDARYRDFLSLVAEQIQTSVGNVRAHEQEKKRADALLELDRAKTLFFSNVSHELRTPLTLMLGPTERLLASSDGPLAPVQRAQLDVVHRNALRLQRLVTALLDFARIEGGREQALFEPTDLDGLTRELASAFSSVIEQGGLRYEVDCRAGDEPVYVDPSMWEKIVFNLLSNAFKFTLEGAITLSLRGSDGHVELEVKDTGSGIPEAELPRLFERFHRVDRTRARTHEGTGIGLALMKDLVRFHHGTVSVTSREGAGSVFTVTIPRGRAHLPAERIREGEPRPLAAAATSGDLAELGRWMAPPLGERAPTPTSARERILLVDDNADMRDYIASQLEPRWEVEAVSDGEAALASARRRLPALVLTDLMMPNLDGFGLLRALRADPATSAVPVIILSARAGDESLAAGLGRGADDYLVKPFSGKELLARVATHVELGRLRAVAEGERRKVVSLLEQAPVAIAVLRGPSLVFEQTNPRYEALVQRANLVGKALFEGLPEVEGQPIAAILANVLATGERYVGREFAIELSPAPGAPAEERFFDFVYEPYRDETGAVDGIIAIALDVSDRVGAARDRERLMVEREAMFVEREGLLEREREARRDAERASRAKDEFLAMLGHELRNPLAPMMTAMQLLRLRGPHGAERELVIFERQMKHLTTLVDDLLDVSRITGGKIDLKREPVEIETVIARAIEVASPLLEQRRHHLSVDVPAEGLRVFGDMTRLAQVVSNLVTNAAKYTEPGGRIEVGARQDDGFVILTVKDNGSGIAPEVLPHVFELFMQERQAIDRSQGGLGLGLAIVRSLVEMHGGTVEAASPGPGLGSTFTIRVPRSGSQSALPESPAPAGPTEREDVRARRVLVVDDNVDGAELLATVVAQYGCEARIANDGPTALTMLASFRPDVALVDIGLPVMDGYELARHIRERPETAHAYLVAVTGYGQKEDVRRAREAGFDRHIVKPVNLEELEAVLQAAGDRAKS